MKNILEAMQRLYPVSAEARQAFRDILTRCEFPAKTVILWAGRNNRYVYFIEQGLTRSYCLVNGREMTTWFATEGTFTCSSLSMYRNQESFEYVQTLEPTVAYQTTVSQLTELVSSNIELANWWRRFMEESFLDMQERHLSRLFMPAEQRYETMLKQFPGLCSRVNLGYIASYLGVTQASLSRIRARVTRHLSPNNSGDSASPTAKEGNDAP